MKKILVVAEKDAKNLTALHRALAIAKNSDVEIDLIGFVHAAGVDGSSLLTEKEKSQVRQKIIDEKKLWLKEQLNKLKNPALHWDVLWEKSVHTWVINRCKQKPYDLVIKTGNRSESFTYTPTDWHLIRECSAPVMIVSNKKWKPKQSILATLDLATDTSAKIKLNKRVIEQAQALHSVTGQKIEYVYVISLPRVIDDLDVIDERKLVAKAKAHAEKKLNTDYKKYGIQLNQIKIVRGSVDKAIHRVASKLDVDIVILGTIGRKGIKGKLIGNTAESVLHSLTTDILTLKS
ncbi:MAG: universal stress protein [Gammaproteobacteria bacterium]|nr:universal stress protein [Gammaproteobacteria bacterium]